MNLNTGGLNIDGVFGEVWQVLERRMNFTTNIALSPDKLFGSLNKDGSWNGIIDGLYKNRTQIGLVDLFNTFDRSQVADFSPSIASNKVRIFIKYPEREPSWTTYLDTLDGTVWVSSMIFIVLVMSLLLIAY